MIYLDDRSGSGDLMAYLIPMGLPVSLCRLSFGDVSFLGRGPQGSPLTVGIELKAVGDLLSSMATGRLSGHQLPGLTSTYDQVWLLVEGPYRSSRSSPGLLEVVRAHTKSWGEALVGGGRRLMYRDLDHYLTTLQVCAGIRVWRTQDRYETARWVADLYGWWTNKDLDQHRSHLQLNESSPVMALRRPSLLRRVASQLPGIGWDRSQKVANHFTSVRDMVLSDESEWRTIPGIGPKTAKSVQEALDGRETH